MKVESMNCPNCGAPLSFEDGKENTYCSSCGSLVNRDMTYEVRKIENQEKNDTKVVILAIAMVIFGCMMVIAMMKMF